MDQLADPLPAGTVVAPPHGRAHEEAVVGAGVLVHVAKFVFVLVNVWLSSNVRNVELYGLSSALVNHVAAQAGKKIAPEDADALTGLAERIIESLER